MSILIILIICFLSIIWGRLLFARWFNPVLVYTAPWSLMLFLYEINLLAYPPLTTETWFVVSLAYFSYCSGIMVYFVARKSLDKSFVASEFYGQNRPGLIKQEERIFKYAIYVIGIIGLLTAIQHWMVLIKMFGSIPAVLINANVVYKMRLEGEIKGAIPYLATFNYIAVFFSAVYSGYKRKITFASFFPFIGLILNDISQVGRAGIYIAFLEFFTTYIIINYLFYKERELKKSRHNKFGFIIIILVIIGSLSLIRSIRAPVENFAQTPTKFKEIQNSGIITPSVYIYFSSHVGILSKYLEIGKEEEKTTFGSNSLLTFYSIFSKMGLMNRPSDYQQGYYIPMWTNTGTYLREIHADFGPAAIFIIPFLLGLGVTYFWFRFFKEKRFLHLIFLIHFFVIIEFSYFAMQTRMTVWAIKLVILLLLSPLIEKSLARARGKIVN